MLAADEGWIGMPLGLPPSADYLFVMAVRHGLAVETAGTLLGIDPARGGRLLAGLLANKRPEVRERAKRAIDGLKSGRGRAPRPRVIWPGASADAGDAAPVALRTLGEVKASAGGEDVPWPAIDARNLAAYLVVNRGVAVGRDDLLRDVWPDVEPAGAHVRLQVAMYQLREALGAGYPRIDRETEESGQYLWEGARTDIDAERFRALMGESEGLLAGETPPELGQRLVSVLEAAVALYDGEFMSDVDFDWCVVQRSGLREQLLRATRLLMDHYMALRDWRRAIFFGTKALKSDPLREEVVRDLMVCYFRIGDRAAVIQQYREVKRLLARDRGDWPAEETRKVRVRLLGK